MKKKEYIPIIRNCKGDDAKAINCRPTHTPYSLAKIEVNNYEYEEMNMPEIEHILQLAKEKHLTLLTNRTVIQWLIGDTSFIPTIDGESNTKHRVAKKLLEDKWGQNILRIRRPDLKLNKQWTNKFGEHICEEIYQLLNIGIKPAKKKMFREKGYCLDFETRDFMIEVKTGTYFTSGTAHEKILGCPLKYVDMPSVYGKPIKIICIGGADKLCRKSYEIFSDCHMTEQKFKLIKFYEEIGFEFVSCKDLLDKI